MNFDENGDALSLDWIKVGRRGSEQHRRGGVWVDGPSFGVHETVWVLPEGGGVPVLVVEVLRRHRYRGTGRWFDPGERYEAQPAVATPSVKDGWLPGLSIVLRRKDGIERTVAGHWRAWIVEPADRLVVDPLPEGLYKALSSEG